VREKNGRPQAVAVILDRFADPRNWKVMSAPPSALPTMDGHAVAVDVVIAPE
jgi:hypothetical protein